MNNTTLQNWIPYQLFLQEEQLLCNWIYLNNKAFTEPFFDETILACRQFKENTQLLKCVSTIDFIKDAADTIKNIAPSVFIFHVSRCGSTLASQLLALDKKSIVLSEVPFLDELIRWKFKDKNNEDLFPYLKHAVALYGQKRSGEEKNLVIKTDSWHVLFYDELRKLFPSTPFILLYRNPAEVIRSHQKRRGIQAVPGLLQPTIFGFDAAEINQLSLDEYMAKVLEKYFEKFLSIISSDKNSLAINYNECAVSITKKIAAIAKIDLTEKDLEAIKARAGFHAKYPEQKFLEETPEEKIPPYLSKVTDLYKKLEREKIATIQYP